MKILIFCITLSLFANLLIATNIERKPKRTAFSKSKTQRKNPNSKNLPKHLTLSKKGVVCETLGDTEKCEGTDEICGYSYDSKNIKACCVQLTKDCTQNNECCFGSQCEEPSKKCVIKAGFEENDQCSNTNDCYNDLICCQSQDTTNCNDQDGTNTKKCTSHKNIKRKMTKVGRKLIK